MHLPPTIVNRQRRILGYFRMLEVRTYFMLQLQSGAFQPAMAWFHVNIWAVINTMGALSIHPKDAFVCPKNPGFPLQSYNLGMGLRPSILLVETGVDS